MSSWLDIDLSHRKAALSTGTERAFVISRDYEPHWRRILFVARKGSDGWQLDVAYHPGLNQVRERESRIRIQQVLDIVNA